MTNSSNRDASNAAWIIDTARSPRGVGKQGKGSLAHIHPQTVLGQVLTALRDRVGFDPVDVDDVVTAATASTSVIMPMTSAAWRCSMPGGRSRSRA